MYLPNFLDGFDRLVAFDAETTGKRTPDAEFIRKQPFAWRAPGIIIEVGFVEMLREGEGWSKGETWSSRVNPDGPINPEAIKIHRIRPADLKNAPRFPTILPSACCLASPRLPFRGIRWCFRWSSTSSYR